MSLLKHPMVSRLLFIGIGLLLILDQAILGGQPASLAYWIEFIVPAAFLWALWASADVFACLHRGDAFGAAMVRGLQRIGAALMLTAFAAIILQPALSHLAGNGFTQMRGARFDLGAANIMLGVLGLILVLLAKRGEALKTELDGFV